MVVLWNQYSLDLVLAIMAAVQAKQAQVQLVQHKISLLLVQLAKPSLVLVR